MSAAADTVAPEAPAAVVFGRDGSGKPHASHFIASEVALAEKAAGLMGMRLLPVKTDAERALAARLPRGKVFASGKGFVPFVKAALYAELEGASPEDVVAKPSKPRAVALVQPSHPKEAVDASANAAAPVRQPSNWGDVLVGSIVLTLSAPDENAEWYEAEVIAVIGDRFTLRFADFPERPVVKRQRVEIGLMHPLRKPEPPLEAAPSTSN